MSEECKAKKFDTGWHTGIKRVQRCEMEQGKEKPTIVITWQVHAKVLAITDEIVNLEWLGYLHGQEIKEGYLLNEISVPKQEVTAGSVDVLEPVDALGTVHLHPGRGKPGHSGTDDKYIAGNHTIMLVTNLAGDYEGWVKKTLPCGASYLAQAEVVVQQLTPKGLDEFLDKALENILVVKIEPKQFQVQTVVPDKLEPKGTTLFCAKCRAPVSKGMGHWEGGVLFHKYCRPVTIERYCHVCMKYVHAKLEEGIHDSEGWVCPSCIDIPMTTKLPLPTGNVSTPP